ncbi:SH2 domain-containing adapter protein D [Manis javanica]|nr:SH2 domain-containing adapter protein D [Manis javanica]
MCTLHPSCHGALHSRTSPRKGLVALRNSSQIQKAGSSEKGSGWVFLGIHLGKFRATPRAILFPVRGLSCLVLSAHAKFKNLNVQVLIETCRTLILGDGVLTALLK